MQTMKRALCFCLALSMALLFTGCRRNVDDTSSVGSTTSTVSSALPSPLPSPSPEASSPGPASGTPDPDLSDPVGSADGADIRQLYEELKSTYGEHYYPTKKLDAGELEEQFGISTDLYSEFIADTSAEDGVPDTLVIVKALEGKEQEVEDKLNAYRDSLLADEAMTAGREKVEASKVHRNGLYVFYVMLGETPDDTLSGEGLMEALGKEIDKGIDAIEKFFDDMM